MALWNQKLGDSVVVCDYHVILVLRAKVPVVDTVRSESGTNSVTGILNERIEGGRDEDNRSCVWTSWVYDFDSRLNMPCNIKGEASLFFLTIVQVTQKCTCSPLRIGTDTDRRLLPPPYAHPECMLYVRDGIAD